jgi:hypothetical protein
MSRKAKALQVSAPPGRQFRQFRFAQAPLRTVHDESQQHLVISFAGLQSGFVSSKANQTHTSMGI